MGFKTGGRPKSACNRGMHSGRVRTQGAGGDESGALNLCMTFGGAPPGDKGSEVEEEERHWRRICALTSDLKVLGGSSEPAAVSSWLPFPSDSEPWAPMPAPLSEQRSLWTVASRPLRRGPSGADHRSTSCDPVGCPVSSMRVL